MEYSTKKPPTRPQENQTGDDDYVIAFGNFVITENGSRILKTEILRPTPTQPKTVHHPASLKNQQTPVFQEPTKPNITEPISPEPRIDEAPMMAAVCQPVPHNNYAGIPARYWQLPVNHAGIPAGYGPPPVNQTGIHAGYGPPPVIHTGIHAGYGQPPVNHAGILARYGTLPVNHAGNPVEDPGRKGKEVFSIAVTQDGSDKLKNFLRQGNFNIIYPMLYPYFIPLMADKFGQRVFEALLEHCNPTDLLDIMQLFIDEKESFLRATQCEPGSRSIQSYTRKLKNTRLEVGLNKTISLENLFTNFLSDFARPELMCHKIASHVIRKCFTSLGDEANEILYDCVAKYFQPLALDTVGCLTINDAIDSVRTPKRFNLFSLVIRNALQLSLHQYGNYVVQHVLDLKNELISAEICKALKGGFAQLSATQGGSRVVEKCLKSEYGRMAVVDEIMDETTLSVLAKDGFGNYVVQSALKVLGMHDQLMYQKWVRILKPRHQKLVQKVDEEVKSAFKCY